MTGGRDCKWRYEVDEVSDWLPYFNLGSVARIRLCDSDRQCAGRVDAAGKLHAL
jgi:hypothetical protein